MNFTANYCELHNHPRVDSQYQHSFAFFLSPSKIEEETIPSKRMDGKSPEKFDQERQKNKNTAQEKKKNKT